MDHLIATLARDKQPMVAVHKTHLAIGREGDLDRRQCAQLAKRCDALLA
jgi:hypothetical protein